MNLSLIPLGVQWIIDYKWNFVSLYFFKNLCCVFISRQSIYRDIKSNDFYYYFFVIKYMFALYKYSTFAHEVSVFSRPSLEFSEVPS